MMFPPFRRAALDRLRRGSTEFFGWWRQELIAAWNDLPWRRPLETALTTVAWPPDADSTQWSSLPAGARLRVMFPAELVLTLTTVLPRLPRRELDAAVALWLERQLPVPLDQVRYTISSSTSLESSGQCQVTIRVMLVREITAVSKAAQQAHVTLVEIGLDDGATGAAVPLLQLSRPSHWQTPSRLDRGLLAGGLATTVAVTSFIAWQWVQETRAFDDLQHTQRPAAEAVLRNLREIASRQPPLQTLRDRMALPTAGEVLSSLTTVLPEDTWVIQLSIKSAPGQTAMIRGTLLTFSSRKIDGLLREAAYLAEPRIENTTVFDTRNHQMRVEFTALLADTAVEPPAVTATPGPST